MTRVKYNQPVRRFKKREDRVDEEIELDLPDPHCHICRQPCEGKAHSSGSYRFRCKLCDVLVMTWEPPVFEAEPETEPETAVPLAQAVQNAALTPAQKLSLAAAGAASIGTALWQLLSGG